MGFMDKMKDLVGIVDDYDDDEYEVSQEEVDAYKKEMSAGAEPAARLQHLSDGKLCKPCRKAGRGYPGQASEILLLLHRLGSK